MSMAYALTDSRVMVTRCVRRSLRDPEAFFTALMLPEKKLVSVQARKPCSGIEAE